jgi:hypothetical protein
MVYMIKKDELEFILGIFITLVELKYFNVI